MGYKCHAIGNILGNTLVATEEPKKNKFTPPKKPKRKKLDPPQDMLSLLIGHMKNYGPKTVGHQFSTWCQSTNRKWRRK